MPTPQTNTTLSEIAERLRCLDDFAICGHVNPDGDCLGSQLALMHALHHLGKRAVCLLAKPDPIDPGLAFLPGIEGMVPACDYEGTPDAFVAVDVPTVERIGQAAPIQARAGVRITVDHHAADARMSELTFVEPESPSASMLVWELAQLLDAVTPEVAQCALTGLVTDTGRFGYQNTTPAAFRHAAEMVEAGARVALINREVFQNRSRASLDLERIVLERMDVTCDGALVVSYLTQADFDACGAIKADAEPLVDTLRSVRGARVALMLREAPVSEGVRGSLRAKDDVTDVAQVARLYGGGGHRAAAGFTFTGTMGEARIQVPEAVRRLCLAGAGE